MICTLDTLTCGGQFSTGGGYIDANGVEWILETVTGWFGTPGPALKETARPVAPGVHRAAAYKGARTVVLTVVATHTAQQDAPMRAAEQQVAALCSDPSQLYPLVIEDALGKLQAYVELAGEILPTFRDGMPWSTRWSIPVSAVDPRRVTPSWTVTTAPASSVGYGGIDSTGTGIDSTGLGIDSGIAPVPPLATVLGGGTTNNPLVFAVTGPGSGFVITSTATGATLTYGGTLGPTDTVYINTDTQPAYDVPGAPGPIPGRGVLLGAGNVRSALTVLGGWPTLPPGAARGYLVSGSLGAGAGLSVYTRGAYA